MTFLISSHIDTGHIDTGIGIVQTNPPPSQILSHSGPYDTPHYALWLAPLPTQPHTT